MVAIILSLENIFFFSVGWIFGLLTIITFILAIWIIPKMKSILSLINAYHKIFNEEKKGKKEKK